MVVDLAPFPLGAAGERDRPAAWTGVEVEAEASLRTPVTEVKEQVEERVERRNRGEVQPELAPAVLPEVALEPRRRSRNRKSRCSRRTSCRRLRRRRRPDAGVRIADVAAAQVQGTPTVDRSNATPTAKNGRPPCWNSTSGIRPTRETIAASRRSQSHRPQRRRDVAPDRDEFRFGRARPRSDPDVRRSQPFPPPPAVLPGAEVSLTVPVRFNMR